MAAVKKRYGTSRKPVKQDLQTAEEVQEKLEGFWLTLQQYRYPILGGLGALFLVVSILSVFEQMAETESMEANSSFSGIMDTMNAPVFDGDKPEGFEGLSFATDVERGKATVAAANSFLAESNDAELKELAGLISATAEFEAGAYGEAGKRTAESQTALGDSPLKGILALRAAVTSKSAGDAASAKLGFNQAMESENTYVQIQALKGLGDLANPAFGGAGDGAVAREQYEKCVALVDQVQDQATQDAMRADLEGRLSTL